ncbi:precorrin-2 dehydrogenase/sirohydrochlorin ferrochelatase family protein [Alteraurantiacibacter aquimixticola]|uniref:precorrin-2 dehydrogenase n=1 Tax=Alteraurantiacibacter aquimixticola TaxID=2489173 RepID=A0A4T3F2P5_9SPHN|nr:bifunctional precorrin-2 dehydrogenase/sirohydrochlorin ferrochelatase [Alteraurantiacibacter aquimixticola]TIX50585.1 siroheme synthase [Alteraurantiacibacter aquimixticola]
MKSLPLFHRLAGQPVIVLGEGGMAEPKRRLIERAGAEVIADLQEGVDKGARLAFIAHEDAAMCEADAIRARCAGLLVNVVDRPDLCDFTTPSILERDPVLIAIGTSGASAGLAKQVRLRLEQLLPTDLGTLAQRLSDLRDKVKAKWPAMADRRQALDRALSPGGPLDPLAEGSADRIDAWLEGEGGDAESGRIELILASNDPEDLTLRQARLLGSADVVLHDPAVPQAILDRSRADALRFPLPFEGREPEGLVLVISLTSH